MTSARAVSELFDDKVWRDVPGFEGLDDVTYHLDTSGRIARIAFNRPEVRNAFRPRTVDQLASALDDARQNPKVGVVLLTGNGPSRRTAGGRSRREATSASGARTGISTRRVARPAGDCTSSRCSG